MLILMILLSCSISEKNNLCNRFNIMKGDREEDYVVVYCQEKDNSC